MNVVNLEDDDQRRRREEEKSKFCLKILLMGNKHLRVAELLRAILSQQVVGYTASTVYCNAVSIRRSKSEDSKKVTVKLGFY